MKNIFKMGAALSLLTSLLTPTSAIAETSNLEDAVTTYEEVAPQMYAQTEVDTTVEVVENAPQQSVTVEDARTATTSDNVRISFSVNGREAVESNGIAVYDDTSRASTQLIQPLADGFRIIRILENSQASPDYTYEITIPKGAILEPVFGSIRVVRGDEIFGSLKTPWALDANGNQLPTSYKIDGNLVTQHIDVAADTTFPVVADPAWGYLYAFSLVHTPTSDWNKLHRCFNCYFPVTGAPALWPTSGQLLPLRAGLLDTLNMECKMGSVGVTGAYFRWQFNATKNHFDGLGSYIIFQLSYSSTGRPQLIVDAYIVKDLTKAANDLNASMAWDKWYEFASNLNK